MSGSWPSMIDGTAGTGKEGVSIQRSEFVSSLWTLVPTSSHSGRRRLMTPGRCNIGR
jgi:hypothetical protein